MLTFLWNLNRQPLEDAVSRITRQHQVDVLILAECEIPTARTLERLTQANDRAFHLPYSLFDGITIYTRFSAGFLTVVHEDARVTIRRLKLPMRAEVLIAAVHLPSKLYQSEQSQSFACTRLARSVRESEEKVGHTQTLLVGDFNMNPFESGVVASTGLHGVMTKELAARGRRTVQGEQYPFFYNAMWSCFGDRTAGPSGTYYYAHAEDVCYFWNMFDQVLVRPALLDRFQNEELRILTTDGEQSLLSAAGLPDRTVGSDHLPVLFKLEL